MIEVSSLYKNYGKVEALRGLDFSIQAGEVVGLLGPNGAGKTTLLKILTCFHYPTSGTALVNGLSVVEQGLEVKASIGYLGENAPLYEDSSVYEFLSFAAGVRGLDVHASKRAVSRVLSSCELLEVQHKRIDTLSKGFRQRVGLAQALIHDPSVLILDEPSSGLDPNQIVNMRSLIRELGREKTVILSTHILQEVEAVCSRILILNDGHLVADGKTGEISRKLSSTDEWVLVVNADCSTAVLEQHVARLPHLSRLVSITPLEGQLFNVHVELSLKDDKEAGLVFFDWARSCDVRLSQIEKQEADLEAVFRKLTNSDTTHA